MNGKMINRMRAAGLVLLLMTTAAAVNATGNAQHEPYIRLKSGQTLEVKTLKALDEQGNLAFENHDGSFIMSRRLYDYAVVPQPSAIAAAVKMLQENRAEAALKAFGELERQYRYLGWAYYCRYYRMMALQQLKRDGEMLQLPDPSEQVKDEDLSAAERRHRWQCRRLQAEAYLHSHQENKAEELWQRIAGCPEDDLAAGAYNRQADLKLSRRHPEAALTLYLRPIFMFERHTAGREYALRQVVRLMREQQDPRLKNFTAMLNQEYPEKKTDQP
ncbi:MAG: hypothetical protein PHQ27_00995 [Victivallales bacterium]|nr:hypothetical protein [Victivallales bacterium]